MANYKGHIVGGLALGTIYAAAISWAPVAAYAATVGLLHDWQALAAVLVIAVLFGLFPDIDTNSKAQDILLGLAFIVDIVLIASGNLQAAAYLGLIAMLPIVSHHRGWTHSKLAMFIVPLPIAIVPYLYEPKAFKIALVYYGAGVAGYFSHLLLDGLIFRHFRIKN